MTINTRYMTRNDCYTANRKITPKGIMVHSTAAPGVMAAAWFDRWNKSYQAGEIGRQSCVHAFLDDKEVWQYLPWNHRGWHAGGDANNTHIGFEICEPKGFKYEGNTMVGYDAKAQEAYFRAAWQNAVALCVFLCKQYNLTEKNIICHSEGYKQKIASNHGDVMHWFPKHAESMDSFRAAVKAALAEDFVPGVYQVTLQNDTFLNLRQGPGTKYAVLAQVKRGESVQVTAQEGSWGKAEFQGKQGYLSFLNGGQPTLTRTGDIPATPNPEPQPVPDPPADVAALQKEVSRLTAEVNRLSAENAYLTTENAQLKAGKTAAEAEKAQLASRLARVQEAASNLAKLLV